MKHSKIILTGIFPRNDKMAVIPTINKINERMAKFADGKDIRYININDKLKLGEDEARQLSPLLNLSQASVPLILACGGGDSRDQPDGDLVPSVTTGDVVLADVAAQVERSPRGETPRRHDERVPHRIAKPARR